MVLTNVYKKVLLIKVWKMFKDIRPVYGQWIAHAPVFRMLKNPNNNLLFEHIDEYELS